MKTVNCLIFFILFNNVLKFLLYLLSSLLKIFIYDKIYKNFVGGVIALSLTACTTDSVFEDIDQQNAETGSQYQTNSFDDSQSGGWTGGGASNLATNYFSPWDIWYNRPPQYRDLQPSYGISNGDEDGNLSPYRLEVHAWIGLAYFDGNNDGLFHDISPTQFGNPSLTVADMIGNPTQYQNLFVNNQEVGNLVKATITNLFEPQESARIEDRVHHLPMPGSTTARYTSNTPPWAFGPWSDGFTPTVNLSPDEEDLLRDYGKVFFYEVEVFEAATNAFVGTYILHPEIQTLPQGPAKNWHPVTDTPGGPTQLQGSLPFGSFNLHYYTNASSPLVPTQYNNNTGGFGNKCNSYELVFDTAGIIKHQQTITGSVLKTLSMEIWQDSGTFWQRSWVNLRVH